MAVTKSVEAGRALELARLGQRDLGESRATELERKASFMKESRERVHWHFIGHLQSNKVRRVVRIASTLHSIDSAELLQRVAKIAREERRSVDVMLQVHLSGEDSKHGLEPADVLEAARLATKSEGVRLRGLMTMAPLVPTAERDARSVFAALAELGRRVQNEAEIAHSLPKGRCQLSMGMSGDFEQAIEEGAHWVRVGSALFEGLPPRTPATTPLGEGEA